jgi:transcriptional regulator with XRE-family HTH domain
MTTRKRDRGYSTRLVADVDAADPMLIWVRFAKLCITKGVPVRDVAEKFGVTRATVYSWFTGRSKPRSYHISRMMRALDKQERSK